MSQQKLDISVLRGALGVFVICLTVAGVMLATSFYFREQMNSQNDLQQTRFRDVSRQYLSVDEDERVIADYLPKFRNLYDHGILGQEKRLNWLETLKIAGDKVRPPKLAYEIHAQKEYFPDYPINKGAFDINASEMDLTLGLLHEGDLFDVLEILNENALGLFSVSACEIYRPDVVASSETIAERIEANCQLRWFTVDLRGERVLEL